MSPRKKFHNHLKEVKRRTGEIVPFEKKKIEEAIYKALTATDEGGKTLSRELSIKVIKILNRRFKKDEIPSVEEIQDIVEEVLILENLIETSKAYILYRDQRRKLRESRIVSEEAVNLVDEYLKVRDWEVKENSNMAFSLQGLNHYVSAYVAKKYWLRKIYPKEIREAVETGDFHIHNLDILATYCCGWDLYDLLSKGFGGVFGKIQSKPPKHFGSALGQIVNFFYTLQGEGAGAQAFSNFDTLLAPFIRYDNLNYHEVKQNLQEFLFNCNVPTRVGFQTPFENITLDLKVPVHFKDLPVIIGGQAQKETYQDFQKEMDVLNQAFCEIYTEGDASGRVFTFPIPTYNITKDFEWNDPAYEGIWKMTAKYGIPYFCLDENTEIFTDKGVKKIKDISLEDKVLSDNGTFKQVVFKRKIKSNKNILLEGNEFSIVCSFNHRFPTKNGLKMAQDLSLNDDLLQYEDEVCFENGLVLNNYYRQFFKINNLDELKKNKFVKLVPRKMIKKSSVFQYYKNRFQTNLNEKVKIPDDLNEDLMELIGIILGDGSIRKNVLRVVNADKEIIDFVIKTIKNNFRLKSTIRKAGKSEICKEVSINSAILVSFLENIGIKGNVYTKRIPEICFWRKEKEVSALLRGLFDTDGSVILNRRKDHIISISFASQALIKDTLVLLAKIGIIGKINGSKHNRIAITGERNIKLFREKIGFRIKKKEKLLSFSCKYSRHPSIGDKIVSAEEAKKIDKFYAHRKGFIRIKSEDKYPYLFISSYRREVRAVSINKIETIKREHVLYDLTVASKNHLFVLKNGIISHNSNFINSDMSPEDARSMCPLDGSEKVLIRSARGRGLEYSTIKNIYYGNSKHQEYEIYSHGRFVKGRFNSFPNQEMIDVVLDNNHKIKISKQHLNFVLKNEKSKTEVLEGKELKAGMYLPYSLKKFKGKGGNKDLGYFVGAFAGDGSFDRETSIVFSLENEKKKRVIKKLKHISEKYFGANLSEKQDLKTKLYTLKIHSRAAVGFCKDFVAGQGREKYYREKLFGTSLEFRRGVLCGHYDTDGGNRNRIYTSSQKMVESLNMLAATMGTTTSIYRDSRKGRFSEEPNYAVLIYQLNRKRYGKIWFKKGDKLWVRIKKIKSAGKNMAYCFEVKNDEPIFTVGTTGILTHNCRLRLDNRELYKRGGGLFGANPLTGSIGVVTINMPRLGYVSKTKKDFFQRLVHIMDLAKESLEIKRKILEDWTEKGLYPYAKHYLSEVKKLRGFYWGNHFSTIGLIGMNEALLNFLGIDSGNKKGIVFAEEVLDFMRERLIGYQEKTGNLYNLEATPAEGASYRLALKDKKKYPDIITAGIEEPYYTNSTQLPVNYTDDLFEALKLQDSLQTKYTGGCIEKGNKVLTDKGLIKIEEIVKNFEKLKPIKALSYNPKKGISEWDKIIDALKINVEKKNKIRIKGENGMDITTSDWHPFFVLKKIRPNFHCPICQERVNNIKSFAAHLRHNSGCRLKYSKMPKYEVIEKRADEIKKGDYILQNSFNLYPGKISKLNNDLMWLIGFFIGDGSISRFFDDRGGNNIEKFVVRFFSEHQEAIDKVKSILNKYFNCHVSTIQNDKRSKLLKCISTSKKDVYQFFFRQGFSFGEKTYKARIPEIVKMNIRKENFYSLLSGLMDSDGHIDKRDGSFEYYTVSELLADDILEICSIAGIMVSKKKKKNRRKNEVDIWRIRIPQCEMIKMKDRLKNTVHKERISNKLSNRMKRFLPVARVKKVSKVDVRDSQFYDLTTQKNHNYLAGNNTLIFIHNTVFHAFLGEAISDPEAVKSLIKVVFEKFHLPYLTLTPTFSVCPTHGYITGEHFICPKCTIEQPCEVYSRIVGYLRPVQQWHKGKQEEFKQRSTFNI